MFSTVQVTDIQKLSETQCLSYQQGTALSGRGLCGPLKLLSWSDKLPDPLAHFLFFLHQQHN
jgi:hypothetical protein